MLTQSVTTCSNGLLPKQVKQNNINKWHYMALCCLSAPMQNTRSDTTVKKATSSSLSLSWKLPMHCVNTSRHARERGFPTGVNGPTEEFSVGRWIREGFTSLPPWCSVSLQHSLVVHLGTLIHALPKLVPLHQSLLGWLVQYVKQVRSIKCFKDTLERWSGILERKKFVIF